MYKYILSFILFEVSNSIVGVGSRVVLADARLLL